METDQKLNFCAYCRESINLETGIEEQKEKIKKYCEMYNINIIKWYIENDTSAFGNRVKYNKMIEHIFIDDTINGVIVSNITRFGRKTSELLEVMEQFKTKGKEMIFIDNNLDTTTTSGKAMFGMLAVFAEFERDTIRERTARGIEYAKIHGTKSGKPMHRPVKKVDWKKYDDLYLKGLGIPAIAKMLGLSKSKLYLEVKKRINSKLQ